METMEQLKERHRKEERNLEQSCPHKTASVIENSGGWEHRITVRCEACQQTLFYYIGNEKLEYACGPQKGRFNSLSEGGK